MENDTENMKKLPGFVKGWTITDLVFSAFRIIFIPLSIIGYNVLADEDPIKKTAILEIIFHVLILISGLSANITILLRKQIGHLLGKINVGVGIASFTLVFIQLPIQLAQNEGNNAVYIGMLIGAIFTLLIRVALLVFYAISVKRYGVFINYEAKDEID
jgi:hypothetical protein